MTGNRVRIMKRKETRKIIFCTCDNKSNRKNGQRITGKKKQWEVVLNKKAVKRKDEKTRGNRENSAVANCKMHLL